jgi:tRNA pseudouridine38-40 synthase
MRCIRLDLEYEGTHYHGWQVQPGVVTVQEVLEQTIFRITGQRVRMVAAGRTDAGVHALGQVAHFRTDARLDSREILLAMNSLLPPDIAVKCVSDMPQTFHARKDAAEKRYEYWIWNGRTPSVFSRGFTWHLKVPLNVGAMRVASQMIPGTRNFSSFQAAGSPEGCSPVRAVTRVEIERFSPGTLRIVVEGQSFLRHMVRILVGTLVDVGVGRRKVEDMGKILMACDRKLAGRTAPARGLFLKWVRYPELLRGGIQDGADDYFLPGVDRESMTG